MDKKIKKLENLVMRYLSKSKSDIIAEWGNPLKDSDYDTFYYQKLRFGIFKDDIALIFQNGRVADIMISEYFMGIHVYNIFYNEEKASKYRVVKIYKIF